VSNELPDLDEDVSFVVDEGAPVGPMPLRSIIDSIRSGERDRDVLVWWAGAPDWVQFGGEADLRALLQELPATNQPSSPPAEDPVLLDEGEGDVDEERELETPEFDPVAEAEARVMLARDSRAMHPSSRWGLDVEEQANEDQGEQDGEEDEAVHEADPIDASDASDRSSDFEDLAAIAPGVDDAPLRSRGLSGLFGAPTHTDAGLASADRPPASVETGETVRSSLETVGARIEALTSATRARQQLDPRQHAGASENPEAPATEDLDGEPEPTPERESASESGSWQVVDVPDLDERFAEMVTSSIERQRRLDWALRVDELLLSACITAVVDSGFVLLDLATRDSDHRALFDHNDDSRHVRLEISPLSPLNAAGDPIGRHVRLSVAWGREVADADAAFQVVRSEVTDDEAAPGTFTCEMNMVSSSASVCVALIWKADEFVTTDHNVDRAALDASIAAILHALEQRWHELFVAAY